MINITEYGKYELLREYYNNHGKSKCIYEYFDSKNQEPEQLDSMNERGKKPTTTTKKSSTVTTVQVTCDQISEWDSQLSVRKALPWVVCLGPDYDVFMLLGFMRSSL